jgi:hypothetical protein
MSILQRTNIIKSFGFLSEDSTFFSRGDYSVNIITNRVYFPNGGSYAFNDFNSVLKYLQANLPK